MYIIEGTIGAGKSTFLKKIQQYMPTISICFEPLPSWHNEHDGQSLLNNFYSNPRRWAYTLELATLMARVQEQHTQKITNTVSSPVFMERSFYSGYYCFAKNSYINGFLTDCEWRLYCAWFDFFIRFHPFIPQGFIYLKVDPDRAYTRVLKRHRHAEQSITPEYIQQLSIRHDQFLIEKRDITPLLTNVPVLVLNVNQEFEHDHVLMRTYIHQIYDFLIATGYTSFSAL